MLEKCFVQRWNLGTDSMAGSYLIMLYTEMFHKLWFQRSIKNSYCGLNTSSKERMISRNVVLSLEFVPSQQWRSLSAASWWQHSGSGSPAVWSLPPWDSSAPAHNNTLTTMLILTTINNTDKTWAISYSRFYKIFAQTTSLNWTPYNPNTCNTINHRSKRHCVKYSRGLNSNNEHAKLTNYSELTI